MATKHNVVFGIIDGRSTIMTMPSYRQATILAEKLRSILGDTDEKDWREGPYNPKSGMRPGWSNGHYHVAIFSINANPDLA